MGTAQIGLAFLAIGGVLEGQEPPKPAPLSADKILATFEATSPKPLSAGLPPQIIPVIRTLFQDRAFLDGLRDATRAAWRSSTHRFPVEPESLARFAALDASWQTTPDDQLPLKDLQFLLEVYAAIDALPTRTMLTSLPLWGPAIHASLTGSGVRIEHSNTLVRFLSLAATRARPLVEKAAVLVIRRAPDEAGKGRAYWLLAERLLARGGFKEASAFAQLAMKAKAQIDMFAAARFFAQAMRPDIAEKIVSQLAARVDGVKSAVKRLQGEAALEAIRTMISAAEATAHIEATDKDRVTGPLALLPHLVRLEMAGPVLTMTKRLRAAGVRDARVPAHEGLIYLQLGRRDLATTASRAAAKLPNQDASFHLLRAAILGLELGQELRSLAYGILKRKPADIDWKRVGDMLSTLRQSTGILQKTEGREEFVAYHALAGLLQNLIPAIRQGDLRAAGRVLSTHRAMVLRIRAATRIPEAIRHAPLIALRLIGDPSLVRKVLDEPTA